MDFVAWVDDCKALALHCYIIDEEKREKNRASSSLVENKRGSTVHGKEEFDCEMMARLYEYTFVINAHHILGHHQLRCDAATDYL